MTYAKYTWPYIRDKAKLAKAYHRMGVLHERLAEQRRKRQQLERRLEEEDRGDVTHSPARWRG